MKRVNSHNLAEIFDRHDTLVASKWTSYLDVYDEELGKFRDLSDKRLLEIGIQNGGSLEVWAKFFPFFKSIEGIDVNIDCSRLEFTDPRIICHIGNQCDPVFLSRISSRPLDIIVDDGSHKSKDTLTTFVNLFPAVSDEGVYVVEDLVCSYLNYYDGGLDEIRSSISFFKKLADVINFQHWRNDIAVQHFFSDFEFLNIPNIFFQEVLKIKKIVFHNSMVFVYKNRLESDIGHVITRGRHYPVVQFNNDGNGLEDFHKAQPFVKK